MVKLVIIADDFTGAIDTGVQFAEQGVSTQVVIDRECDLSSLSPATQVAVIDAETRHLSPKEAYDVVFNITKSALAADAMIYKKTDSALRGCIGSELTAVLDASPGCELVFLPAFPQQNRVTIGGTHYMDRVPIHESVFGNDPFEPVRNSYIPDIIGEQSEAEVSVCKDEIPPLDESQKRILVFDAESDDDLWRVAHALNTQGRLKIMAGCAGLASILPALLEFDRSPVGGIRRTGGLFVVCGSLNPITKEQVVYAGEHGFHRIHITPQQKLDSNFLQSREGKLFFEELRRYCSVENRLILDTFGNDGVEQTDQYAAREGIPASEIRHRIANRMGQFAKEWLKLGFDYTLFLTGGDTLLGFMNQVGCREIQPVGEVADGAILSLLPLEDKVLQVITKSGGFGGKSILVDIAEKVI